MQTTLSIILTSCAVIGLTADLPAQQLRTNADSMAVVVAAITHARSDLLMPANRRVLVLEQHHTRRPWSAIATPVLARALGSDAMPVQVVSCVPRSASCTAVKGTELVSVSDVATAGDSAIVTVGVTRRSGSGDGSVSWRAREYVLVWRGAAWVVDHVRTFSAI